MKLEEVIATYRNTEHTNDCTVLEDDGGNFFVVQLDDAECTNLTFEDEESACTFQRQYRYAIGLCPMCGSSDSVYSNAVTDEKCQECGVWHSEEV